MKFNRELVQVLCPYGEWRHSRGMQVVDFESARRMKRSMGIFRYLGAIPIYMGHPDDYPGGEKIPVGKIVEIFPIYDAIAVVARYCDCTFDKVVSGEISAMSPRWQMEKLPSGKYRPVRLLSVGLTNNPNIPASGSIISAAPVSGSASEWMEPVAETLQRVREANCFARECARKIEAVRKYVELGAVEMRASGKNSPFQKTKKTAREICELARERSIRTGEPYTKSFAALKRTIS